MFAVLARAAEPGQFHQVVADALGDPDRLDVLSTIVHQLPSSAVPAVLATVRASGGNDDAVADALVASAPRMDEGEAADALAEALQDLAGSARARAVAALLPRTGIGPEQVDAALEQVLGEADLGGDAVLEVLEAAAGRLPGSAAPGWLDTVATLPPSVRRARVATVLAATLPVPAARASSRRRAPPRNGSVPGGSVPPPSPRSGSVIGPWPRSAPAPPRSGRRCSAPSRRCCRRTRPSTR